RSAAAVERVNREHVLRKFVHGVPPWRRAAHERSERRAPERRKRRLHLEPMMLRFRNGDGIADGLSEERPSGQDHEQRDKPSNSGLPAARTTHVSVIAKS